MIPKTLLYKYMYLFYYYTNFRALQMRQKKLDLLFPKHRPKILTLLFDMLREKSYLKKKLQKPNTIPGNWNTQRGPWCTMAQTKMTSFTASQTTRKYPSAGRWPKIWDFRSLKLASSPCQKMTSQTTLCTTVWRYKSDELKNRLSCLVFSGWFYALAGLNS